MQTLPQFAAQTTFYRYIYGNTHIRSLALYTAQSETETNLLPHLLFG